jgi:hypothetical protein
VYEIGSANPYCNVSLRREADRGTAEFRDNYGEAVRNHPRAWPLMLSSMLTACFLSCLSVSLPCTTLASRAVTCALDGNQPQMVAFATSIRKCLVTFSYHLRRHFQHLTDTNYGRYSRVKVILRSTVSRLVWESRPIFLSLSRKRSLYIRDVLVWGDLSDEKTGLRRIVACVGC